MENKTLTAVEWLVEKITDSGHLWITDKPSDMIEISKFIEQAKQMFEEQIKKAALALSPYRFSSEAEQYYNKTYK